MPLKFTGRSRGTGGEDDAEVPLAPLIDMIFILLIFFLVTASFVQDTAVDITKPSSVSGNPLSEDNVMLSITPDGTIVMDDNQLSMAAVKQAVGRKLDATGQDRVVIAADRTVSSGTLVKVIDRCKMAGAKTVSVATKRK